MAADLRSPDQRAVVLSVDDAAFLAARLRRLFQHFGMLQHIPKDMVADDARLIGIAGSAIGILLTGRTDGVRGLGDGAEQRVEQHIAAARGEPLRHATKDSGDCPHWCNACAAERAARGVTVAQPALLRDAVQFLSEGLDAMPPMQHTATAVVLQALTALGVMGDGDYYSEEAADIAESKARNAGVTEAPAPQPVNGIPATLRHDEGAVAQCFYCRRYTLDPKALSDRQPVCECGKKEGWSGSFKKPSQDAKWSGRAPGVGVDRG